MFVLYAAGETFYSIQGDMPQIPVTSIVYRDGQLLIGTDFGAFASTDAEGSQRAPLGNGLPNVPVSMLKLQPGNPNKLFASTFGRHIWTYEFPADAQLEVEARNAAFDVRGGALGWGSLMLLVVLLAGRARRSR